MRRIIGKTDKIIRMIIGLGIAALGFYYQTWWGLLSIIPLGTAFFKFCGLYTLLGINTCHIKKQE